MVTAARREGATHRVSRSSTDPAVLSLSLPRESPPPGWAADALCLGGRGQIGTGYSSLLGRERTGCHVVFVTRGSRSLILLPSGSQPGGRGRPGAPYSSPRLTAGCRGSVEAWAELSRREKHCASPRSRERGCCVGVAVVRCARRTKPGRRSSTRSSCRRSGQIGVHCSSSVQRTGPSALVSWPEWMIALLLLAV